MNHLMKVLSFTVLAYSLSGCGGGGSSSSTPTAPLAPEPTPEVLSGVFLDSEVTGLSFETTTQNGSTDADGAFSYIENEQITFSIGDIQLPTITASSIITPLTIFDTDDINHIGVVNLARLLQSLDTDGIAENGIEISDTIHSLAAGLTIDFLADDFEVQVQPLFENNGGVYQDLIPREQALAHLQLTLDLMAGTPPRTCGTDHPMVGYTGTFQTYAHNVAGTATIIDNCTIEITSFDYDGGGPLVYFYASDTNDFTSDSAFRIGPQLNGQTYENATLTVKLSEHHSLDSIQWLSVWCIDFNANFGDLMFEAP